MNRTNKILIGSSFIAGMMAIGAFSYSMTKRLVSVAMDRDMPANMSKAKENVSGSNESDNFINELNIAAEKLLNSNYHTVEIKSHDGINLVGHWKPCKNAKRIIIAMHGWRSSWAQDFGTIADFWHNNNCSVLYAEQRGQNNSGGEYIGFGMLERFDCLEWIKWVNNNSDEVLPIYLGGVSMGATTVLMTASMELPDNVHGIIADCGFTTPHAIWKHVAENNLHISYKGLRGSIANGMCRKKIKLGSKDCSTLESMKECSVPVLFIHGTDDKFVPVEMTYENYKACSAPKRLFVVPGAGHGMSYYMDKEGYERAVIDFWHST